MKRSVWAVTFIAVAILISGVADAAEKKFGVIDIQIVIDSVDEGKKAKTQMEKAILDRKNDLEKEQKDYKKMEEDLEKQKLILSPAALADKQRELDSKKSELQNKYMAAQAAMQKKELSLTGDLLKKIRAVVSKIGEEGNYEFIWEKNEGGLVFYKDTYDVTDQAIKEYNKAYKKK